jgi:hypothetical protein
LRAPGIILILLHLFSQGGKQIASIDGVNVPEIMKGWFGFQELNQRNFCFFFKQKFECFCLCLLLLLITLLQQLASDKRALALRPKQQAALHRRLQRHSALRNFELR